MGKIKRFFAEKSIKKAFAIYMVFYILLALVLSVTGSQCFLFGQDLIEDEYWIQYENRRGILMGENYDDSSDPLYLNYYTEGIDTLFEPFDGLVYNILGICSVVVYPVCFVVSIGITSILFYKRQLKKPLEILDGAADHIADNNLDFEIVYDKQDELGKLCSSFEKMRLALRDGNLELWRQMEERKRLNAAFAHDLRTPLTVLKGQSEMLMKYTPKMSEEKIMETAEMMKRHITRLENYVNTMNVLQRFEDIEIRKQLTEVKDLVKQMEKTGISVCEKKNFELKENRTDTEKMQLDVPVILQVYENLLANAVRYAEGKVIVSVYIEKDCFCFTVSDDGKGFSEKDLSEAAKAFYKADKETDSGHFGMGLYICKILCEKHGGFLKLENRGGAFVTAVFQ